MRKDYISDMSGVSGGLDETAFVEEYWTRVWENEGGPKGELSRIPGRAEFKIMGPYLRRLPDGGKLLDGGCGLGNWTAYLSQNGYPTIGLDLSRETVKKLKTVFPDVDFRAGDIRQTDFEDSSFDGYFSWGVFEHFEDGLQPCISEAYRILKPGGFLFVSVPFDNLRHALRSGGLLSGAEKDARRDARFYQWRLTRAELEQELLIGGFGVQAVKPIHKRQGILRSLHHEFKLPYEWLLTKGLSVLLTPVIPGGLIAHMIMAVAQKPIDPNTSG